MIQIQPQRHFKTHGVYGTLGWLSLEQATIFLRAFCSASQSKLQLRRRTASTNRARFQSTHCKAEQVFGERLPGGPAFRFCTSEEAPQGLKKGRVTSYRLPSLNMNGMRLWPWLIFDYLGLFCGNPHLLFPSHVWPFSFSVTTEVQTSKKRQNAHLFGKHHNVTPRVS